MTAVEPALVEIRIAEPEDGTALIRAIERIDRETEFLGAPGERLGWADQPEAMLQALRANSGGLYVIARQGDAVIGYAGALAGHYRSTRGVFSIPHIGVGAAQRRQGVAARLLATLETAACQQGAHRLDLTVDAENQPARALYAKLGFVEEGCVREAVLDRGVWRSYVVLAKLFETPGTRAMAPVRGARTRHTESLEIGFRPVLEGDAAALRAWELALLSAPPPLLKLPDEISAPASFADELRAVLASSLHFLVVAVLGLDGGERIVGLLAVSVKPQVRLQYDAAIVVNVLAEYRGLGIGRRLVEIGEDWARARNSHRLSASVHAANEDGLRFATAHGFEGEIVMRRYARFGDVHVDLVGLAKRLD